MANIRIKDLSTTASTTASDDFFGVDGATNGTRKLNAYSPTFGGNLTVSGTGTVGGSTASIITPQLTSQSYYQSGVLLTNTKTDNAGVRNWALVTSQDSYGDFQIKQSNTLGGSATAGTAWLKISETGATTLAGNLTVSGTGTSSVAGILTVKSASAYANLTVGDSSASFSTFIYGNGSSLGVAIGTSSIPIINGYNNTFGATQNLGLQTNGGNLLIGTAIDGGQKLQVNGTAAFSGAITVSSSTGASATFTNTTDNNWSFKLIQSGGNELQFSGNITGNSGPSIRAVTSGGAAYAPLTIDGSTVTAKTYGTTVLTLTSDLSATFAGTVIANKATTAFRIPTAETPASASATGTVGTITWDASYIYVCTAANTWKRVAIATW